MSRYVSARFHHNGYQNLKKKKPLYKGYAHKLKLRDYLLAVTEKKRNKIRSIKKNSVLIANQREMQNIMDLVKYVFKTEVEKIFTHLITTKKQASQIKFLVSASSTSSPAIGSWA